MKTYGPASCAGPLAIANGNGKGVNFCSTRPNWPERAYLDVIKNNSGTQSSLTGIAKLSAAGWTLRSCRIKSPSSMPRLKGFRFPREIIAYAVWAYHRFALSTADLEDLLAERGVIVSREAIRLWGNRFGAHFASCIRRDRPRPNDKWHLDEVLIAIGGIKHWLWRTMDANGDSGSNAAQRQGCTALPEVAHYSVRPSKVGHHRQAAQLYTADRTARPRGRSPCP